MLDFISIKEIERRNGTIEITPIFKVSRVKDLMVRGKSFYAIWDEHQNKWSTNEYEVARLVDAELFKYYKDNESRLQNRNVIIQTLDDYSTNQWDIWKRYCKSLADNCHELNSKVMFNNDNVKKEDYMTQVLPYDLKEQNISNYEKIISTLYDPDERQKIEWIIGSVINGASTKIQKFAVFYGEPGSGKSTILNIIQDLFKNYYSVIDAKSLGQASKEFALEILKDNPLLAIQHDGDLSKIDDNTRINSIVSHEYMEIHEKFKASYKIKFRTFILMGTNKPVKITDSKSGLLRRLIDIVPSGRKLSPQEYEDAVEGVKFELGGIAKHCLDVFNDLGSKYYNNYIPTQMMETTNSFYNFIEDNIEYFINNSEDGVPLSEAWKRYKVYCEDANLSFPMNKMAFKSELKVYFNEFSDRDGKNRYNIYTGFKMNKFKYKPSNKQYTGIKTSNWIKLEESYSGLFEEMFSECPAQYAKVDETPSKAWSQCKTKLKSLDPTKIHYILTQSKYDNLICVDFDLKNESGEKDMTLNLAAASKWPKTYAELSKGGAGLHLYYLYDGDVNQLSRIYDENIEIKVFTGKSSLRRRLSKCNDIPIQHINSGLPLKEDKKVLTEETIKSEKKLREMIIRNIRKEIHADTSSSINFIYQILEDAYNNGVKYDVTDMRNDIQQFAANSSNQADRCLKMVSKMKFKSEEPSEGINGDDNCPIVFYDVEVFPNLFVVCWKKQGPDNDVIAWINPTSSQIEELRQNRLVGFNNRKYDNHMLYARMLGYSEFELFNLSQNIIENKEGFFGEAYNLSYTDIYDFLSSANKMSLKKWEIKLGIHHQEFGLPWDKPVPENLWHTVADYCKNDVIATEAVWDSKDGQADWLAREILADLSGKTVNDTTNTHTTQIIVGDNKNPQSEYIYTDLSTIFPGYEFNKYGIDKSKYKEGAKIVTGKSIYKGEDPGEGGRVYSSPGMYSWVVLLDIASMHPHSLIKLKAFGEVYTMRFKDIVDARIYIKHKDYDKAKNILDGKLAKYLDDPSQAKKLANALKTAINSVYGLTSATFPNKLKDPRNVDNIVAKYGALFMMNLQEEVEKRGYKVVHVKTDSIKIADADMEIINFVNNYGKEYGYTFEHEATYSKLCIVNESTYIAKHAPKDWCQNKYGYVPEKNQDHENEWTATGTQFQVPYVFKTLFSHEPLVFEDMCETKSATTSLYLNFNENGTDDYRFVGRVGSFCPMQPGHNSGILLRADKEGLKYSAVTGTKKPGKVKSGELETYLWMESEMVKSLKLEKYVDRSYYNTLVDKAVETISQYGDAERFMSNDVDEDLSWMRIPYGVGDEIPFDIAA